MNPLIHFPAHLITGNHKQIESQILEWLQEITPHAHDDTSCPVCHAIQEKNFYTFSWIAPDNRYTLENIERIFKTISLQLAPGQHHFFIVTRAELLTQACANTLLKIVEEPPTGYHFIFTAPHNKLVLPTIVSRCVETSLAPETQDNDKVHPLIEYACSPEENWAAIHKEIAQYSLNEHETIRLFETVLNTFTLLYRKKLTSSDSTLFSQNTLEKLLHFCKMILDKPLQPGSSKIIWKDFFMYKTVCLLEKDSLH